MEKTTSRRGDQMAARKSGLKAGMITIPTATADTETVFRVSIWY